MASGQVEGHVCVCVIPCDCQHWSSFYFMSRDLSFLPFVVASLRRCELPVPICRVLLKYPWHSIWIYPAPPCSTLQPQPRHLQLGVPIRSPPYQSTRQAVKVVSRHLFLLCIIYLEVCQLKSYWVIGFGVCKKSRAYIRTRINSRPRTENFQSRTSRKLPISNFRSHFVRY